MGETGWIVGGRNGAAVPLGVKRTTLIWKMQKLGIDRKATLSGQGAGHAQGREFQHYRVRPGSGKFIEGFSWRTT